MSTSVPNEPPVDESFAEAGYYGYGYDDCMASTRTLASSAESYRFENGRRYHAYRDGSYWGPNDERDKYHQTITHHLYCLLLKDKLFLAPLSDPSNVLDIGTGRGLWAMDFADQHPEADIIGTDLSPVWEPTVQPNLRFELDDCCSDWAYPPDSRERFDFIHMRGMYGSVSDWGKLYKECYNHLVPGGYIEQAEVGVLPLCDMDGGPINPDSFFGRLADITLDCQKAMGKPFTVAQTMKQSIIDAGFVDVVETKYKIPLGTWDSDPDMKEIGRWYRNFWDVGIDGWFMAPFTRYLGWSVEKVNALVAEARKVFNTKESHVYFEICIVYGRKPPSDESA